MNLQKYNDLLFANIKNQISKWFENDKRKNIPNEEVYRFLHSIKGTSGTLNLNGLLQISSSLLEQLDENKEKIWFQHELRGFLYPLLQLSYEYENFEIGEEIETEVNRYERAPLVQVIDDDISMLILLKDALEERGWMVIANADPVKATNQYFDMHPDCLVIDVNMPNKNGFEILQSIHKHNEKQFVPKIMISAEQDRKKRIDAFKMGADDFIEKPIDIEEFIVRIERQIQRKQLFDQSVLMDELTQVYNRKFLKEVYKRHLDDVKRSNNPFTIAVLDIDHFKKVNDTYGHGVGDKVLYDFAQYLSQHVRSSDTVFRFGGEEFIILFPEATYQEVKERMEELIKGYSDITHMEQGQSFSLTFSAGVFMIEGGEIQLQNAIERADQALYEAKHNGRSRVEISNDDSVEPTRKKLYVSVIDDDVIIRTMLPKMLQTIKLERVEMDVEVFEDGSKFFAANRPNIEADHFVILDGIMPVMDGVEVLQKIKRLNHARNFNILMLTGRKSEKDIARALSLGADDYLTKPFSLTELQARIHRLIVRIV